MLNKLRDRIVVQTDGQLKTGRDVVIAALLGAEEYGFATAPLVVMGCIMMRVCHLDTCPVGIATQNPKLREKFQGQAEHVVNFFQFIAEEVRELMAAARLPDDRRDDRPQRPARHAHAPSTTTRRGGSTSQQIFYRPEVGPDVAGPQGHATRTTGSSKSLDQDAAAAGRARPGRGEPVTLELPIRNVNRTVGTILGSELTRTPRRRRPARRHDQLKFTGSAGQSFGAFVPRGITPDARRRRQRLRRQGALRRQDHRLPAARRDVRARGEHPDRQRRPLRRDQRQAFFRGVAGERFCVRNSGAMAVVEGTGDHGCEYMTGGGAVVIGATGRNFAAGMSGGVAFVSTRRRLRARCNLEMVDLEPLDEPEDVDLVRDLLIQHAGYTGSTVAAGLLKDWDRRRPRSSSRSCRSITGACSWNSWKRAANEARASQGQRQKANGSKPK